MAQQTINLGAAPNDGTGDELRSGGDKINDNFDELYAAVALRELLANKDTDGTLSSNSDTKYPSQKAVKTFVEALVSGLLNLRGGYDASTNVFPSTGGSGTAGAVRKGDLWFITEDGTLGGQSVVTSDCIFANIDTPGQTAGNWTIMETNIGFVPENVANKDTDATFAANSATRYPSQSAVKTAIDLKGYILFFGAGAVSPADATTYYYGNQVFLAPPTASAAIHRVRAFGNGIVRRMNVECSVTGAGSGESVTIKIRNVTTSTEVTATASQSFAATFATQYTGFALTVSAGDEIEVQIVAPTWVTNPTGVGFRAEIFVSG